MEDFEQLVLALHSSRNDRWRKAADVLRQRGEPGGQLSAEEFIAILRHDTLPMRKSAAEILHVWREYVPIEPLLAAMPGADEQIRLMMMRVLADLGAYAWWERLLSYLADANTEVRAAALSALGAHVPIAAVLEAIFAPDEELREVAISLVDLLKEQMPAEPLIAGLQMSDARLRVTAARALGLLGERIPIAPLLDGLHDAEVDVRLEAIRALANTGKRMPIVALRVLLDDANQGLRRAAAKALVRVGDLTALAIIVQGLHADHEWARESALSYLLTSTNEEIGEIAYHLPIEELLHLLEDKWWPVGIMSARLIATLGEQAPFARVLALLSHPLPQARRAAFHTLALLSEHVSLSCWIPIDPVLTALEDEDAEVRREAAQVLNAFGPQAPVERLLPLMEDDDTKVAHILARRGWQEGKDALVACSRTQARAREAVMALGELGKDAPAKPLLAALCTSDAMVCLAAAEALYETHQELLPQLVPELLETLCSGQVGPLLEPLQRVLLVRALAALHSTQPAVLACFEQALDDSYWEVRMWAVLGLSWVTPKTFEAPLEKLQRLLDDPESASVRRAAGRALEHLMA